MITKLIFIGEKHSSLVTNSAPLHVLSYSPCHLNINDNGFCFKISRDPTAMILTRVEKFEGRRLLHKFRIRYPKFSFQPFHSFFKCESFSILWQLQFFNPFSIFKSLHCQDFKSWKSRDYQLLILVSSCAMNRMGLGSKINVFFFLLL